MWREQAKTKAHVYVMYMNFLTTNCCIRKRWPMDPLQQSFPPLAQTSSYGTAWKPAILFLYNERTQHRSTTVAQLTGIQRCEPPPCQAEYKNRDPLSLYFGIQYCFGSQEVVVFCVFRKFFGLLSGDFGFYYRNPHPDTFSFLNFFLSIGNWAPFCYVSSWLKPLVSPMVYNIIFLNNSLLNYAKIAYN